MGPIKSYRSLYKIETITSAVDDVPGVIDKPFPTTGPGPTYKPIYVLMKKSIGDFLGIIPLAWDAPELTGTFAGEGTNSTTKYRKRIGGFRVASYTLVAIGKFQIGEYVVAADGTFTIVPKTFKTISIGLPKGHSVTEFINFLKTRSIINQVSGIRTPAGRLIPVSVPTTEGG